MMTVIQTSFGNVVSSFFGARFGKHLEELLVSPLAELADRARLCHAVACSAAAGRRGW